VNEMQREGETQSERERERDREQSAVQYISNKISVDTGPTG